MQMTIRIRRAHCFAFLAALACAVFPVAAMATTVTMRTVLGSFEIELFDDSAPLTVANFLKYANAGAYDNSLIHRSIPGFVVQGGGYTWNSAAGSVAKIVAGVPVANEFDARRSNLRGTIAMAKREGDPNSATTEWFINLADNSSNLDNQNGGFTVFGRVSGNGMAVVDAIAALTTVNAGGAFGNLPLISVPASGKIQQEHLALVSSIAATNVTPAGGDGSDRLFDYLEAIYPQYLAPTKPASASAAGYYYRYYSGTQAYIATSGGRVYYLGPLSGGTIYDLGSLAEWAARAASAGF